MGQEVKGEKEYAYRKAIKAIKGKEMMAIRSD
jgi:hypothetical protein